MHIRAHQKLMNFSDLVRGFIKRETWPTDPKYVKALKKMLFYGVPLPVSTETDLI